MRREIVLNNNWKFHKGDINVPRPADKGPVYIQSKIERKRIGPAAYHYFDSPDCYEVDVEFHSEGWQYVNIPHDYIIDQDNDRNQNNALGYFKYDNAWYRKAFTLSSEEAKDKRVLLQFDGISGKSEIYLNGCLMKRNFSSYNSFEVDISNNVYFDKKNVLAIYVNTDDFEGWWYQGGGIYRDVKLLITDRIAIDRYGVYAPYTRIDDNLWRVDLETTVLNTTYENSEVTVKSVIKDALGNKVAEAQTSGEIELRGKKVFNYSANVENPNLWDTENPYLYNVETSVYVADAEVDNYTTRIGFRTVEISDDLKLLINDKPTIIKGVCCHQDFGITGLAVPANIARYKLEMIKEMGANGFRTSHYQNSKEIMDALDEMGFLVFDEARWFETTDDAVAQLEELVKRDRNRPSVIFWSTGNEEPTHITDVGQRVHKALYAHIRKLDANRFITTAEDKKPQESMVYADSDIVSINYNLQNYEAVHSQYPNKAILASECCATGTTRDWNLPSNTNGRIRDKDRDTNNWFLGREKTWKFLMEQPYVIGAYQWAAVEHRGEATWPRVCSVSGAIDLYLQRKGAFYQNKSLWTDTPMVHIVPHWNFSGLEGKEILVTVYTNCDELELFLNGASLGKKEIEKYGHGEWNVAYEAGELKVKGYINGKVVCEDIRKTSKAPKKLKLTLNNKFEANGTDIALFTCECLDENGLVVPNASEFVRFSTTESAVIVGTGSDNCDHNRTTLAERKMYQGKITVAIRPNKDTKEFELYAESDNCGVSFLKVTL